MIKDTLHKEAKSQDVITERAGSSQSAVSNINGKLTGKEKCGTKRCTSNMDDPCLKKIVKRS